MHFVGLSFITVGVFVGFSRIFLLGILIFKGLNARRLYKSLGFKVLMKRQLLHKHQTLGKEKCV
jgi:hypothetical protein